MNDFSSLYHIRPYEPGDFNFIKSTFLKGLYYGDSWFSTTKKDGFMKHYGRVIEFILGSPNVGVCVACLPDAPDVILGYSVLSSDLTTIHWVYVKQNWRLKGIAKSLVPANPTTVTHLTELGKTLLIKFPNIEFDPFKLS